MIRILVVAPTRIYREGLAEILRRRPKFDVVGTTSTRSESITRVAETDPNVILMDFNMPASLSVMRQLLAENPRVNAIMVGVSNVEEQVIACAEAGAGHVTYETSVPQLIDAIECAARGELLCTPKIARGLLRRISTISSNRLKRADILTGRECEVSKLLALGRSNKQIARRLNISVSTVKIHVSHILNKLNARNRTEAATLIYERGIYQHQPPIDPKI